MWAALGALLIVVWLLVLTVPSLLTFAFAGGLNVLFAFILLAGPVFFGFVVFRWARYWIKRAAGQDPWKM
jgi:hypothetical protein